MKVLRAKIGTRIFCLLTGVIFLNMSFFLAEVCLLDIKDRQMIENVCKLVLNGGLEEERDSHSGVNDAPLKMYSVTGDNLLLHPTSLFLITSKMHQVTKEHYLHANHSQIFSPPPDFLLNV